MFTRCTRVACSGAQRATCRETRASADRLTSARDTRDTWGENMIVARIAADRGWMRRVSTLVLRTVHALGVGGWIRCSHSMYLASSRVATLCYVFISMLRPLSTGSTTLIDFLPRPTSPSADPRWMILSADRSWNLEISKLRLPPTALFSHSFFVLF